MIAALNDINIYYHHRDSGVLMLYKDFLQMLRGILLKQFQMTDQSWMMHSMNQGAAQQTSFLLRVHILPLCINDIHLFLHEDFLLLIVDTVLNKHLYLLDKPAGFVHPADPNDNQE